MEPLPPALLDDIVALRRDLHRHPELSGEEHRTRDVLEAALVRLGLTPRRIAGTGLVADVVGDPNGPLVCLRGDLDGLPIQEDTGLPFGSEHDGVMHACGHDIHAAAAVGAAALLLAAPPPGRVRILLQPAEETGEGARACVEAGAMDGVEAVLGGHVDLGYPVGRVAVQAGPICASTDRFEITVRGRGGHGARPHQGVDALLVGARIVVALQEIVSRQVDPGQPAVVTVGRFASGAAANVLAGRARLEGTLRARDPRVREQLRCAVAEIASGTAAASGAEADVRVFPGNPPVVNDPALTPVVTAALDDLLGHGATVPPSHVNMGGEDFSVLHGDCPGVFVRWGARGPGAGDAPAHHQGFRPDEGVLPVAAAGLAAAARATIRWLS